MTRTQFIIQTAAACLHPSENPARQRDVARHCKESAEALATELGLTDEPVTPLVKLDEEIATVKTHVSAYASAIDGLLPFVEEHEFIRSIRGRLPTADEALKVVRAIQGLVNGLNARVAELEKELALERATSPDAAKAELQKTGKGRST